MPPNDGDASAGTAKPAASSKGADREEDAAERKDGPKNESRDGPLNRKAGSSRYTFCGEHAEAFGLFCWGDDSDSSSDGEATDEHANHLSYVGEAAYEALRKKHHKSWRQCWSVTSGRVVGDIQQTPRSRGWGRSGDPAGGHDDWFPEALCDIMSRTLHWCDVCSLAPPDGIFMEKFKEALSHIAHNAEEKLLHQPIIVRMVFGNIIGMPVNCHAVARELTADLKEDANIRLWVGAWRKGFSWNHAKIVAVDGHYLSTGGHNLWDQHYLKHDPVHDVSMELEGRVARDAHRFANQMWEFIRHSKTGPVTSIIASFPDYMPAPLQTRITLSEWPEGKAELLPPMYSKRYVPRVDHPEDEGVPIVSLGRYGSIWRRARPSDDAIVALLDSAQTILRLAIQDLGPITLPGVPGPIAVPGCVWPKEILEALARGIWERRIEVQIILSNPGSIPGSLSPTEALYGNGWTCVDVAAEIVKAIQSQWPGASDAELRDHMHKKLRLCYLRHQLGNQWESGSTLGMHAKHFIIDDLAYYVGSQNLYVCDLAEWGLLIDDPEQTQKAMEEYWIPLWQHSYSKDDCHVSKVMDGLHIDRNGSRAWKHDKETKALMEEAHRRAARVPESSEVHHTDLK